MPDTWFTADFHFGHANIIRYCGRPFETVTEMDTAILDRLNSSVAEGDTLYFLGDFCRGSGKEALAYRKRVRCKNIFFVEGNHDGGTRKISTEFGWWKQLAEVKTHDQVIVLCHYAMRVWHHLFRGSWHLYGHSHGRLPDDPAALSMDVGVDTHEFRPWNFDEIKERMEEKASRWKGADSVPLTRMQRARTEPDSGGARRALLQSAHDAHSKDHHHRRL
jgi:calcineurin-like phosphoesterase family protein